MKATYVGLVGLTRDYFRVLQTISAEYLSAETSAMRWTSRIPPRWVRWLPARFQKRLYPPKELQHWKDGTSIVHYYSLIVYMSEVIAQIETDCKALEGTDSGDPRIELYHNLLSTRPPVPWIIYTILDRQLLALQKTATDVAAEFFRSGGNFNEVREDLFRKHGGNVQPTNTQYDELHYVPPPTYGDLLARVRAVPAKMEGDFPFARLVKRPLAAVTAFEPFAQQLVYTEALTVADVPYLSALFVYKANARILPLAGKTPLEAIFRVMTEQSLLRHYAHWSDVPRDDFLATCQETTQALTLFEFLTQVAEEGERTPAGMFEFMKKFHTLTAEQVGALLTQVDPGNRAAVRQAWRAVTSRPS